MQEKLREVYGLDYVTVINRGYSGDTTRTSFNRWITSSGADLTMISLGINDAVQDVGIVQYIEYYEKIILREINEYGAAVILLSPFKQRTMSPSRVIDAYRNAAHALAMKYGLPFIDAEPWLSGYSNDAFSDATHMNTKGYSVIGARAAALFIGEGPASPFAVTSGSRISVRPTIDNVQYGPGSGIFNTGGGAGTMPENNDNTSGLFGRLAASSIHFSFYCDQADLVVSIPHSIFAGATMTAVLDFGVEQPHDIINELNGLPLDFAARAANSWSYTAESTANIVGQARYDRLLRIASPGWHTLTVTGDGVADVRLYGLEFLSQRQFQPPAPRTALAILTGTASYSPSYGFNGAEVTLDGGVALGSFTPGTWYKVANLPVGFRPKKFEYYPTTVTSFGGAVQAYARVQTNGDVELTASGTTGGAILLSGVRFTPAHYA